MSHYLYSAMIKREPIYIILLFISFITSCDIVKNIETKLPEKYKGKGMYVLEVKSAFIDENDFGETLFGNPLPIAFSLTEDEVLIWKCFIGQKRGEVKLNQKEILSYNPESIYRFSIAEEGIISAEKSYIAKYDRGEWAFDEGKIYLGDNHSSWLTLGSYWIPSMEYYKNAEYKTDFKYD